MYFIWFIYILNITEKIIQYRKLQMQMINGNDIIIIHTRLNNIIIFILIHYTLFSNVYSIYKEKSLLLQEKLFTCIFCIKNLLYFSFSVSIWSWKNIYIAQSNIIYWIKIKYICARWSFKLFKLYYCNIEFFFIFLKVLFFDCT